MKKTFLFLSLFVMTAATSFTADQTLTCSVKNSRYGITQIVARLNADAASVTSVVTTQAKELPATSAEGQLNSAFQVYYADNGPFGRDFVYLQFDGKKYSLRTDTLCNDYYMEETCMGDEIVESSINANVTCRLK